MVKLHAIHPPIKVLICLEKQVPRYTNCIKWLVVFARPVCFVQFLVCCDLQYPYWWGSVLDSRYLNESWLLWVGTNTQCSSTRVTSILRALYWSRISWFIEILLPFPLGSVWLPQYSLWHRIIYTITDLHPGYTKFKHPNLTFIDWLLCIPSIVLRILRMICVWLLPQDQEVGSIKSKDRRMKMIEHVQIDWILTAEGLQVNEKPRWDARV